MRFTVVDLRPVARDPAVLLRGGADGLQRRSPHEHPARRDNSKWLPFGVEGIFKNLPFAIWFYLAIEELSRRRNRWIRGGTSRGRRCGAFGRSCSSCRHADPEHGDQLRSRGHRRTGEPLFQGFIDIFGDGTGALLALIAVVGLVASFHTIIFAYGRNIFSLSRAGYFPWMSITHGKRKTPSSRSCWAGSWATASRGAQRVAGTNVGASLLTMAVFGAVISYFMQMLSFIMLRRKLPDIERPYRSPVGPWGAAIAGIIALVSLVSLYLDDSYRPG